jgi:hypothetical protein
MQAEEAVAAERAAIVKMIEKCANREIDSAYARHVLEFLSKRVARGEHHKPELPDTSEKNGG